MPLTEKQKKYLRGLGHSLSPVVMVGQEGMSEGVARELELALKAHELVKVKARVGDREQRDLVFTELASKTSSEIAQRIGNVGLFYRKRREKPKIVLPDD
jgi:RNA-binding protein